MAALSTAKQKEIRATVCDMVRDGRTGPQVLSAIDVMVDAFAYIDKKASDDQKQGRRTAGTAAQAASATATK
ncbi:hypothetical protein BSFA1_10680 [Burkholderia sp. SFA1]|nr:hypothetical protein BSFA1_10680 [Burkholderia sp. SFA1]